jgi:hypothetical protein
MVDPFCNCLAAGHKLPVVFFSRLPAVVCSLPSTTACPLLLTARFSQDRSPGVSADHAAREQAKDALPRRWDQSPDSQRLPAPLRLEFRLIPTRMQTAFSLMDLYAH